MEVLLVMLHTSSQESILCKIEKLIALLGFLGTRTVQRLPNSCLPCVNNQQLRQRKSNPAAPAILLPPLKPPSNLGRVHRIP